MKNEVHIQVPAECIKVCFLIIDVVLQSFSTAADFG